MKKALKICSISIGILLIAGAGYFFLMLKLDRNAVENEYFPSTAYNASTPILLPSRFINGERFYIKMVTESGDTLLAYGDTGGGICMMPEPVADKLKLHNKIHSGLFKGLLPCKYILFRAVVPDERIPGPVMLRSKIIRMPFAALTSPFLFIPKMDEETKFMIQTMTFDIFLGQNFFMNKAWTFDYKHQQVWVNTPLPASEAGKPGVQQLGFKRNSHGQAIYGHPSMLIEVNGELIEVLFDSGATIVLSETGKKAFNTSEKTIGGSFIASSVFDKWRKEHPEWKYYPQADMKQDVIEVPAIKIGGQEVGPVLFARRADAVWSEGMVYTMDKVVRGAIGGSALKYGKVIIDYNSALMKFEK